MAIDPNTQAVLMLHRLGSARSARLGFAPRPGALPGIASDPRGALLAELDRPGAGKVIEPGLPTSG